MIQETWLDASVEEIKLFNYVVVSRRDRKKTANRGGVMTFQRADFNALIHIKDCDEEERSWHFLNLGIETFLIANWYRPGDSQHDGFMNLHAEASEYFQQCSGMLIAGDLNIHHKRWLRYSNDNTMVGTDMKSFCDFYGMTQLVREPTRKEYLLDLACCDIHNSSVTIHPCIADHKALLIKLPLPIILEQAERRDVWILKKANWEALKKELQEWDWHLLRNGTAEDALQIFLEILWLHLVKHIPRRQLDIVKRSHPWINERSKKAIAENNRVEGTPVFNHASARCSVVLKEERAKHVQQVKEKMASLPRSSKQWWKINRELLHRKATLSSIPTLREDGKWIKDPKEKADIFARNFRSKANLPEELVDTPFFGCATDDEMHFFSFRSRNTKRLFQKLDACKATGGDMISASILKRLCDCLAVPFTIVVRRLFSEGCWPSAWKYHLICPIFKRGSAFTPGNYRGVHITTILSKIAEKIVGAHLVFCFAEEHFWQ